MTRAEFLAWTPPPESAKGERADGGIQAWTFEPSCPAEGAPVGVAGGEKLAGLAGVCTTTPLAGVTFRVAAAPVSWPAEVTGDPPGETTMVRTDDDTATASLTAPGNEITGCVGVAVRAGMVTPAGRPEALDPDPDGTGIVANSNVFAGVAVRTGTADPGERNSACEVMSAVFRLERVSPESGVGPAT